MVANIGSKSSNWPYKSHAFFSGDFMKLSFSCISAPNSLISIPKKTKVAQTNSPYLLAILKWSIHLLNNKNMRKENLLLGIVMMASISINAQEAVGFSKERLKDKIMGGWAGQTIGVTFGGPMEFKFNGTMINAYQRIEWNGGMLKRAMVENPGLFDDLYMDLTFVEVFEREGLDAPASSHAKAIANADYLLWHANQAARYNILSGIEAPQSGHWLNNPHADCIDYQIEADFAGLMSPGMPNTASQISDKIGHIMNYGDGWYGGVYIGAMYSLAFISNDIDHIVNEALKTIPRQSKYYQCISDVIGWHAKFPDDWRQSWFEIQKKWTDDIGCPDGVHSSFNIDATVNSAYVVLGLLYGEGDFTKTMEIATRSGQDADCNPSSAGGILGVMLGYRAIPEHWKMGLNEIEDMDFKYTDTSLNEVYKISTKHALENIERNGGKVDGNNIIIKAQLPEPVGFEQSFEGHFPIAKKRIGKELKDEFEFEFEGNGFVITGENNPKGGSAWQIKSDGVADIEMYIDGKLYETIKLPINTVTRRHEICWKYQLEDTRHSVKLRLLNPDPEMVCSLNELITYSSKLRD